MTILMSRDKSQDDVAEFCRAAVVLGQPQIGRRVQTAFRALQNAIKAKMNVIWDPKGLSLLRASPSSAAPASTPSAVVEKSAGGWHPA
jgi:hypothetical protein